MARDVQGEWTVVIHANKVDLMANWQGDEKSGRKRAQQRQREREQNAGGNPAGSGGGRKADWRRGNAANAAKQRGAKDPGWTHQKSDPTSGTRIRHRLGIVLLGAISLGLIIALVVILLNQHTKTDILVVIDPQGGSSVSFGTHAYGTATAETLDQMQTGRDLTVRTQDTSPLLETDSTTADFSRKLKLISGGPNKDTSIVYISAAGAVDDEGIPYLVRFSDGKRGISIKDLLKNVHELKNREGEKIPFKLVVIDSKRIEPIVSPDLMLDRFPGAVEKVIEENKFDGVHVLLSHANGQRSWSSPELGRTVFSHYVASGLAGEADENKDKRITLKELGTYVNQSVGTWVENRLSTDQTPYLIPTLKEDDSAASQQLTYVNRRTAGEVGTNESISLVETRSDEVQQKWEALNDQTTLSQIIRYQPYQLSRIESILVRLESLVPESESPEWEALQNRVDTLIQNLDKSIAELQYPKRRARVSIVESIVAGNLPPLVDGQPGTPNPDLTTRFDKWMELNGPSEEPGEQEKQRLEYRGNLVGTNSSGNMYVSGLEIRWLVWKWLRSYGEDGPPQDVLARAVKLLKDHKQNDQRFPDPELIEIKLLFLAEEYIDLNGPDSIEARKALSLAMSCREQSEASIFEMDRRAKYWVQRDWERAEESRRLAEDLLFAYQFEQAISEFKGLSEEYTRLSQAAREASERLDLHEQVLHDVPWLMAWYAREYTLTKGDSDSFEAFKTQVQKLQETMTQAHELGATLYETLPNGDFATLSQADVNSLRENLAAARKVFSDKCSALIKREVINLSSVHNALMCPIADPEVRAQLRTQYKSQLSEAQTQGDLQSEITVKDWSEDSIKNYRETIAGFFGARDAANALPFEDAQSSVKDEVTAVVNAMNRQTWLFAASQDQLLGAIESLSDKWLTGAGLNRRDQLNRLLGLGHFARLSSPYIVERMPAMIESNSAVDDLQATLDHASTLEKIHWDLENVLLADRAIEDFWGNGGEGDDTEFYFGQLASVFLNAMTVDDESKKTAQERFDQRLTLAEQMQRSGGQRWIEGENPRVSRVNPYEEFGFDLKIDELNFPTGIMSLKLFHRGATFRMIAIDRSDRPEIRNKPLQVEEGRTLETSVKVGLPSTDLLEQRDFRVMLTYRGHEAWKRFSALPRAGRGESEAVAVNFIPANPTEAKVTVNGGNIATSDVVIVIDCSYSMSQEIGEVLEGRADVSRLFAAKSLVTKLLKRLEEAGIYRVAVVAYGHRVAYNPKTGVPVYNRELDAVEQKALAKRGIEANVDVEVLVPFPKDEARRPTDRDGFALIRRKIAELTPWGQTPLYHALKISAEELNQPGDGEPERQILVITDGVDWPNTTWPERTPSTDERDIADIMGDRAVGLKGKLKNCRMFMVLYDIRRNEKGPNIERGKRILKEMATVSGGESIDSKNYRDIEARMAEFVKTIQFSVNQKRPGPSSIFQGLNETWKQVIGEPGRQLLSFNDERLPSKDLFLYGGERLDLDLQGQVLSFNVEPKISTATGVANLNSVPYRIGLVDLKNNSRWEQFKFSVLFSQANDLTYKHVDRPGHAILDVELLGRSLDSDEVNYRLYDFDFEPDLAYPVLRFPQVEIDTESRYRLTLQLTPQGSKPLKNRLSVPGLEISQDRNDPTIRIVNDVRLAIHRGQGDITINATCEDPAKLKELIVICPGADAIHREYYPPVGTEAVFRFDVNATALENGEIELQGYLVEDLFYPENGTQKIEFSYP